MVSLEEIEEKYALKISKGNLEIGVKRKSDTKVSFDPALDIQRNISTGKRKRFFGEISNFSHPHGLIAERFKYADSDIIAEKRIRLKK